MKITADMIKALRAETNAGVLDCRKALEASDGDFQKAVEWLREKGMATAASRTDREASNGTIEIYYGPEPDFQAFTQMDVLTAVKRLS